MKTSLLAIIAAAALLLNGCQSGVNDQLIIDGVSIGVSTALTFVTDANARATIKNYLQGYAPGLRTITSNPQPAQLAALIQQYTPQNIKDQYPQVVAFATPLVINAVESAIAHYGTDNATVVKVVNDVATGLEIGSTVAH